jgi:hypothetical protein
MRNWLLTALLSCVFATRVSAGFFVIANYTPDDVTFTVAEPGEKSRPHTIPAYSVLPIPITGPADLKLPVAGKDATVRVELANAYALIPDRVAGLRITGLELPGQAPERDARPEPNPVARKPVKIPVTLLVDDADPRADKLWRAEVRKRFDAAADILEKQTGFRFEFAAFDTWVSDNKSKEILAQLNTFETAVKVKAGALAVGFTSQKLDDAQPELGACRGMGASHVLVREWRPKGEPERVEVLVRYLAISLGAVTSPDVGSVMRAKLGDGQALHSKYVIRLDPLNVLALNLMADQRRAGVILLEKVPLPDRVRLFRAYSALLLASPGDPLAVDYVNALEKDVARVPDPKNPNGGGRKEPLGVVDQSRRIEAVRIVVRAITEKAKSNNGAAALSGDELTAAYVRTAAVAAQNIEEVNRISAFLLGIGVALDDAGSLRDDPITAGSVTGVETDSERQERLSVLGNPTLRNRRDLCRRFVVGCGTGDLLTPTAAENSAIGRAQFDQHRPSGFSFSCLAAEFAGIAFARSIRENPDAILKRFRSKFSASDIVPDTKGLRDGFGPDKFEDEYGGVNDERFKTVLLNIRKRIQSLPIQKIGP